MHGVSFYPTPHAHFSHESGIRIVNKKYLPPSEMPVKQELSS